MKQIICAATLMVFSSYVGAATVIGNWDDLSAPVDRYAADCTVNGAPAYSADTLPTSDFTATVTATASDTVRCRARGDYTIGGVTVPGFPTDYLDATAAPQASAPTGFSIIYVTAPQ